MRPLRPWTPRAAGSSLKVALEVDANWVRPQSNGTGQIVDGAGAAYIFDQAPVPNPVVQATALNQPIWRQYNHPRARPVLFFDGSNDFLLGTALRTFRTAMVVGMALPPNSPRTTQYGVGFPTWQGGVNRGVFNLNATAGPPDPDLILTGLAATTGISGNDWAGIYGWGAYKLDGVTYPVNAAYAGIPRASHIWQPSYTAPGNFTNNAVVIGRDRTLAGTTSWYGIFRGALCFDENASPATLQNGYEYLMRRWFHSTTGVVVLGDSVSQGFGLLDSQSWPSLFQTRTLNNFDLYNFSTPGQTIPSAITEYVDTGLVEAALRRYGRKVLVIWLGTNDTGTTVYLVNGGSVATCLTNLTNLIARLRAIFPDLIVVGATFGPRANPNDSNLAAGWTGPGGRREQFDVAYRSTYAARGVDYLVDIAADPVIGPDSAAVNPSSLYPDGVHPSAACAVAQENLFWSQALQFAI